MRGKVCNWVEIPVNFRITPAYAGKSLLESVAVVCGRDHPRLCGEKMIFRSEPDEISGSPPPMRGKVIMRVIGISSRGITPAYAGKSNGVLETNL